MRDDHLDQAPDDEERTPLGEDDTFRHLFELAPEPMVVTALDGTRLLSNAKARELFKYHIGSSIPANVRNLYRDPADRERFIAEITDQGEVERFETELRHASGEYIPVLINARTITFRGEPAILGVIRDNRKLRAAQVALQHSEDMFRNVFRNSAEALFLVNEEGIFVDCNSSATELYRCPKAELLKTSPIELSPARQPDGQESRSLVRDLIGKARTGERVSFPWRHALADGTLIDCMVTITPVEQDGEQLLLCSARDVTEKRRAEKQLLLDEIRFEALYTLSSMLEKPESDILDYALEAGVRITESEIGYIYFVTDDESKLTLHAWSKNVMPQCSVLDYPDSYYVEDTGLWGDAVRQRKAVITNNYETAPSKKGYPKGHVRIRNHMNIPLFEGGKIVLLAGVGNKYEDYTDEDVRQLSLLMEGMWNLIRRKQAAEELLAAHAKLETRVKERTLELTSANDNLVRINKLLEDEVAQRLKAEKEMLTISNRLTLASEAGKIGVWEWDVESGDLVWDQRMMEMYKVLPGEFSGLYEAWRDRIHPDDLDTAEKALMNALKPGENFDWEFRIVWPDGEIRHIKANAITRYDDSGKAVSMTGANRDVTESRRIQRGLRRTERIISSAPDMISLIDENDCYALVNEAYLKAFSKTKDEIEGHHIAELIGQDNYEAYSKSRLELARQGESSGFEAWLTLPNQDLRYFAVMYYPVPSEEQDNRYVAIHARDITALREAERDRQLIFELSMDMLCIFGFDGWLAEINPAWTATLGWSEKELKNRPLLDFIHPDDLDATIESTRRLLEDRPLHQFENRYKCKDGSWRWLSWNAYPDIERRKIFAVVRDVTQQKEMIEQLGRLASTDPLTGASNRRTFFERARAELDRVRRYSGTLAVLMLDIDHFKAINDTYGHDAGDLVLKRLVDCCHQTLRASDIFARLGGEEFAAVLVQTDSKAARQTAERLRQVLGELEIDAAGAAIRFTVSIGLALLPSGETTVEEALKVADKCLYTAKETGRNKVVWEPD